MGSMTATTEPAGLPPGPLTVADLEGMPSDGHRYELLDGVLVVTPAPSPLHQRTAFRLAILLDAAAPPGIEVLPAPLAVRPQGQLPPGEQGTELQPDIVVAPVADFTRHGLPVAPLLAVEVLSPSTRLVDLNLKRAAYEQMGAASYWVVDPDRSEIVVFELDAARRYVEAARARGDEQLDVQRPFPLSMRPADLVRHR